MKDSIQLLDNHVTRYTDWPSKGQDYYDFRDIYKRTGVLSELAFRLAYRFIGKVDLVVTALPSLALGEKVASHLSLPLALVMEDLPGEPVRMRSEQFEFAVYPEDIPRGSKVLLVDTVITDGSKQRVINWLAVLAGAESVQLACLLKIGPPLDFVYSLARSG